MSKYTIVKSGAWYDDTGHDTRSAYSDHFVPGNCFYDTGLRLGLDPVQPQRIVKSGSWLSGGRRVRSAHRSHRQPCFRRLGGIGLRLALTTGPVQPRRLTTVAGGAWYDDTDVCRSAYRDCKLPVGRASSFGIRLGLDTVQPLRVRKGSCWFSYARSARSAYQDGCGPGLRARDAGLRLALTASI